MKSVTATRPGSLEHRFKDQRLGFVAAGHCSDIVLGGHQPATVIFRPQQGGESRPGVDSRSAPPPSTFGGTTEIMKEIIGRGLGL
jgi:hypothetical protein